MFSQKENEYLKTHKLARVATVSSSGQPDLVPVGFEFDERHFWIGSLSQESFLRTKRYLNVKAGNRKVAMVVDDLESVNPWKPRFIKIYGIADVMEHEGRFGKAKYLRITPTISWSAGIQIPDNDSKSGAIGARQRTKTIHKEPS